MNRSLSTLKIALVGPCRAGKTLIANQIDGRPQLDVHSNPNIPSEYSPTVGCRILSFTESFDVSNSSVSVNVELWDSSGDPQFENTWPCIANHLHGCIVVFDPTSKDQANEVRVWCDRMARMAELQTGQMAIFAHGELTQAHKALTVKDKTVSAPILNVSSKQGPTIDDNGVKVHCPAKREFKNVLAQCYATTQKTDSSFM